MRVLSIQQPWAWAIIYAGKDIENRPWKTRFREKILIHAGKKIDWDGAHYMSAIMGVPLPEKFPTGGIVGAVTIIDCVQKSDSRWFDGPNGFVLFAPEEIPFIPLKGQLGFFHYSIKKNRST